MIVVDELLVEPKVLTTRFACDVKKCKGACCTMPGGSGAPLTPDELEPLEAAYDLVKDDLLAEAREAVAKQGPWVQEDGKLYTTCVDNKACVFVVYGENDIAQCAIEKAWHEGGSTWRKPLSCHLFPIRVTDFGGPYLHYEEIDECEDGRKLGEEVDVHLVHALQEPLTRAFGEEAYTKLIEAAEKRS